MMLQKFLLDLFNYPLWGERMNKALEGGDEPLPRKGKVEGVVHWEQVHWERIMGPRQLELDLLLQDESCPKYQEEAREVCDKFGTTVMEKMNSWQKDSVREIVYNYRMLKRDEALNKWVKIAEKDASWHRLAYAVVSAKLPDSEDEEEAKGAEIKGKQGYPKRLTDMENPYQDKGKALRAPVADALKSGPSQQEPLVDDGSDLSASSWEHSEDGYDYDASSSSFSLENEIKSAETTTGNEMAICEKLMSVMLFKLRTDDRKGKRQGVCKT